MKVLLLSAHEHAGIAYPAGTEIDVPEADAAFLKDVGACAIDTSTAQRTVAEIDAYIKAENAGISVDEAVERTIKGKRG